VEVVQDMHDPVEIMSSLTDNNFKPVRCYFLTGYRLFDLPVGISFTCILLNQLDTALLTLNFIPYTIVDNCMMI
jgi:hypothetical protein